jgi:hypothetical protein
MRQLFVMVNFTLTFGKNAWNGLYTTWGRAIIAAHLKRFVKRGTAPDG